MKQRKKESLATWVKALARQIAHDSDALLSELNGKFYLTGVGDKYVPELRKLSDALLREGGWYNISSDYVEQRVLEILLDLNSHHGSEVRPLLEELSESLDAYEDSRTVYVALTGVKMIDVGELRFGEVFVKKMTEAQKEELTKGFETEEDRAEFFRHVRVVPHAEITVSAEPVKAWQIAVEKIRNVLDLLRYSMPFLFTGDLDPDIELLGRGDKLPVMIGVHSGKVEYLFGSDRDLPTTLDITEKAVKTMDDAGVFQVAEFVSKESKTILERKVLRSIEWASDSQLQREPENKLLSLIISLESLLPSPRASGTGLWAAEGTAILLGQDLSTRKAMRNMILGLYRKRNNIVHGGESEEITPEDVVWLRSKVHDLIKTILNRRSEFETTDGTYNIGIWLEDYKLRLNNAELE